MARKGRNACQPKKVIKMTENDEYVKWIRLSISLIYLILMCIQFWTTPIGDIHLGIFVLNAILAVVIFLVIDGLGLLIILILGIIGTQ